MSVEERRLSQGPEKGSLTAARAGGNSPAPGKAQTGLHERRKSSAPLSPPLVSGKHGRQPSQPQFKEPQKNVQLFKRSCDLDAEQDRTEFAQTQLRKQTRELLQWVCKSNSSPLHKDHHLAAFCSPCCPLATIRWPQFWAAKGSMRLTSTRPLQQERCDRFLCPLNLHRIPLLLGCKAWHLSGFGVASLEMDP